MYSMQQIRQMADNIKQAIPGCEVLLFGSYAWGRPKPSSDVDLAIVVNDDAVTSDLLPRARVAARHGDIPIDVVGYRRSRLASLPAGSLGYEIRTRGVVL